MFLWRKWRKWRKCGCCCCACCSASCLFDENLFTFVEYVTVHFSMYDLLDIVACLFVCVVLWLVYTRLVGLLLLRLISVFFGSWRDIFFCSAQQGLFGRGNLSSAEYSGESFSDDFRKALSYWALQDPENYLLLNGWSITCSLRILTPRCRICISHNVQCLCGCGCNWTIYDYNEEEERMITFQFRYKPSIRSWRSVLSIQWWISRPVLVGVVRWSFCFCKLHLSHSTISLINLGCGWEWALWFVADCLLLCSRSSREWSDRWLVQLVGAVQLESVGKEGQRQHWHKGATSRKCGGKEQASRFGQQTLHTQI